ncbi:MAG: class I SAM-dependent methyltransferase [Gammaproteobacteria bacterium]|nr:class I SAM-dependent methyltransferase [Gammaproteobacteria bacterium]
MPKHNDFEDYLSSFTAEKFIAQTASILEESFPVVQDLVITYVNEARHGYSLIYPHLQKEKRMLEVGAGIGVLAAYLHLSGFQVQALEPSGTGFDLNHRIGQQIMRSLRLVNFNFLDMAVEDLDRSSTGEVDIIYSVNVVEHLPDLQLAFARMQSVLSPRGLMIHTCPNYHVPYEPHFAVPLIPLAPAATRFLLPRKIIESGLWRSLNFVTASKMRAVARKNRLEIEFENGTMYQSLMRLGRDKMFAIRHGGMVIWIYRFLSGTRLIHLIRYWPALLSTPMNFTCRHKGIR